MRQSHLIPILLKIVELLFCAQKAPWAHFPKIAPCAHSLKLAGNLFTIGRWAKIGQRAFLPWEMSQPLWGIVHLGIQWKWNWFLVKLNFSEIGLWKSDCWNPKKTSNFRSIQINSTNFFWSYGSSLGGQSEVLKALVLYRGRWSNHGPFPNCYADFFAVELANFMRQSWAKIPLKLSRI